jgi:peptidoglycan/xylan/chitin deacetylase (PgdA/CDA1 family)
MKEGEWKAEIEKGVSAVRRALGGPVAPFFRFPYLRDSKETLTHLAGRNIAIFSTDVDSFDFKFRNPDQLVKTVMDRLEKKGKGILLMHDIQPGTAKAVPHLLAELKAKGYKVVHMKARAPITTLAQYDEELRKDNKLPTVSQNPTSSVVRTVE